MVVLVLALVLVGCGSFVVSFVVVVGPCVPYRRALVVCRRSLVGVVHPYVGRLDHVVVLLVLLGLHVHLGMVVSFQVLLFRLGMVVSFRRVLLAFAIPLLVGRMASVGILAFVGSIVVHLPLAC